MYEYNQKTAKPYPNIDGVVINPPARLTAQAIMTNRLPLWVLTSIPPQSLMTLTIKQGGGVPGQALRIPRSKTPFCVTNDHPHESLAKGGKDLWNAIEKGMLVVVWPSDAEVMSGGKTMEEKRTQLSKFSTLNTEKSDALKEHERILRKAKVAEENADAELSAEQSEPTNSRVLDIVSRSKAGEVKLNAAVAEFEALADIMTERDYQYAIANVRGGKLRAWLQEQLASGVAVQPAPKKTKKSGIETLAEIQKKNSRASVDDVFDSEEPEMTDEEREAEEMAAAMARQRQRV